MFGLEAFGAIGQHNAKRKVAKLANRAKLRNFHRRNQQYLIDAMIDDVGYQDRVQQAEEMADQQFQALTDQWSTNDAQLDKIFANEKFAIERSLVNMYQKEYAGSQAGVTASRKAAQSAKEYGLEKSKRLSSMILASDEAYAKGEAARNKIAGERRNLYNQVRFAPSRGPTPQAPIMTPMPGRGSLFTTLFKSALGAFAFGSLTKAKQTGLFQGTQGRGPIAPGAQGWATSPYNTGFHAKHSFWNPGKYALYSAAGQAGYNIPTNNMFNTPDPYQASANPLSTTGASQSITGYNPTQSTGLEVEEGGIEGAATSFRTDDYAADDTRSTAYNWKPIKGPDVQLLV